MTIINWINDHWTQIVATAASIAGAARIIIKLIPTPKAGTPLEAFVELLKHIALAIPAPKETVTTTDPSASTGPSVTSTVTKVASMIAISVALTFGTVACASIQNGISSLVTTIKADLPGWETAANVLWTFTQKASKTAVTIVDSQAFVDALTAAKVSSSTIAAVQAQVTDVNGKIAITQNIVSLVDSTIATASK